ncbi:MAG: 2-oxoglutarate dehydrogenase complex dihydrolipoyllysine-residue succinyltransferase [Alphaproteobacteria bacterium]|nr:2-oxoglutarate dehydrogenase complex dihydrolipoyllysine-residue succinyltransferase [Alphaproteobacteria bacterium]
MTQIVVPALGESVSEATVAKWLKAVGDAVSADEPLVELETDKVTLEVNAPAAGTLSGIAAETGSNVAVGALLGTIAEGAVAARPAAAKPSPAAAPAAKPAPAPAPVAPAAAKADAIASPAARKLMADANLGAGAVGASGKDGRITKGDVLHALEAKPAPRPVMPMPAPRPVMPMPAPQPAGPLPPRAADPREERVRMSRLRQRIAQRLKEAQNNAAMLTTFNEVDMSNVMALREQFRDGFEKKHGVKLGFMSFFVKACTLALKEIPAINAEIYGDEIVYKNYYDIGVAVGSPSGLVVPILRGADALGFADIERKIGDFGKRARDGKLTLDEMTGGTFTISNGGVYGSLLSTPILNPPQSGILGMHKTQKRAVVIGDRIEARPMMYLALSYDHRIVDGREAVTFLVRVKESIEDPQRLLLDM